MMELEELRNTWQEMNRRMESQENLTNKILEKMKNQKYHSKINKISYSEYAGALICYAGAVYVMFNFTKIQALLMQVFAIIVIALLFILPVISLKSLTTLKNIDVASKTYLQAIEDFAKSRVRFQRLQKLNVSLALFLMLVSIPVLSAIQGKDIAQLPQFWTLIFPLAILVFVGFALWVLRSYNRILDQTEKLLSDIKR